VVGEEVSFSDGEIHLYCKGEEEDQDNMIFDQKIFDQMIADMPKLKTGAKQYMLYVTTDGEYYWQPGEIWKCFHETVMEDAEGGYEIESVQYWMDDPRCGLWGFVPFNGASPQNEVKPLTKILLDHLQFYWDLHCHTFSPPWWSENATIIKKCIPLEGVEFVLPEKQRKIIRVQGYSAKKNINRDYLKVKKVACILCQNCLICQSMRKKKNYKKYDAL
jgi:hypothetical protein